MLILLDANFASPDTFHACDEPIHFVRCTINEPNVTDFFSPTFDAYDWWRYLDVLSEEDDRHPLNRRDPQERR